MTSTDTLVFKMFPYDNQKRNRVLLNYIQGNTVYSIFASQETCFFISLSYLSQLKKVYRKFCNMKLDLCKKKDVKLVHTRNTDMFPRSKHTKNKAQTHKCLDQKHCEGYRETQLVNYSRNFFPRWSFFVRSFIFSLTILGVIFP